MKIILNRLVLTNFKGIRSLDIPFSEVTNISGRNGTGKTTVVDAFLWLLFDKDSTDRKDFEVKTLDENNQPYHRLDHEVTGYFTIDNSPVVIRKSMREKWTKPRGQRDEVFAGHETTYFWNEVPLKLKEYQERIAEIIKEQTFKMITNPNYFNSMKWQDRRSMLISMAGDLDNDTVIRGLMHKNGTDRYEDLILALNTKSPEEYRREIVAKIGKVKDELQHLPARIDEANRSVPELIDYSVIENKIAVLERELADIDAKLADNSKLNKEHSDRVKQLLGEKNELNKLVSDREFTIREQYRTAAQTRAQKINDEISNGREKRAILNELISKKNMLTERLDNARKIRDKLITEWNTISAETLVFNEAEFCCPTCKREFDASNVEAKKAEMTENFNKSKSDRLAANKEAGLKLKGELEQMEADIKNTENRILSAQSDVNSQLDRVDELQKEDAALKVSEATDAANAIASDDSINEYKSRIAEIDQQVSAPTSDNGGAALLADKSSINAQIRDLSTQLGSKGQREKAEARVRELEEMEAKQNDELARLEGILFSIEEFTKAKMTEVENRVNSMFSLVKFKMFEEQINGGESETCIALVNGVPFSDANTASKINAGLDIINTLNRHLDVYAPIFIDNRESVTDIIQLESQIVNLIVSPADKRLRVEQLEAAAQPAF